MSPVPVPRRLGLPSGVEYNLIILPWNDIDLLRELIAARGHEIAVLDQAGHSQHRLHPPEAGYLQAMRELTAAAAGIVLIFDKVITGFRLGLAGPQGVYGIRSDLSAFALGLGDGFPVAAVGGRRDTMELASDGTVSLAGTCTANGIAVAAASAILDELSQAGAYEGFYRVSDRLRLGPMELFARSGLPAYVIGLGPVFQVWFAKAPIRNYREAERFADQDLSRRWWLGMIERGAVPPRRL